MRESLKPIEPGCLAILVDTLKKHGHRHSKAPYADYFLGKEVVVMGPTECGCSCCVTVSEYVDAQGNVSAKPLATAKANLIRIDPDEDQRERFEDEQRASDCGVDVFLDGLAAKIRELDR